MCISFATWWARSYYGGEYLALAHGRNHVFSMTSWDGQLYMMDVDDSPRPPRARVLPRRPNVSYAPRHGPLVRIPYWAATLVSGAFAVLLKPKPRLRINLRDVLILVSLAAVVMGSIAALGRFTR